MTSSLSIGFIEPHLKRYGGIRRVVELSNALTDRGHRVTIYVPEWERPACTWLECRAAVRHIPDGFDDPLDMLVFNHEPQWHLLPRFTRARLRAFYALHYARLYGKEGSWESLRAPVDLRLANSTWTAEMIAADTGHRPQVLLGGINPAHFRPVDVPKRYPVLCVGDDRAWKGTATIQEAARLLGLPLERYAGKDLPQHRMAAEYSSAEVFAVGSTFEGFGQPGLEALACGTPLATTDNGGCRDYAIDGETALVVPPDDPAGMAAAIRRLRDDRDLADRLARNALELVRDRFRWEAAAQRFEELVTATLGESSVAHPAQPSGDRRETEPPDDRRSERAGGPGDAPPAPLQPHLRGQVDTPELSVVVLAWDQLLLTQRCVESIRQHTDVPYELIIVDNGSGWGAANYAAEAADIPVLNDTNLGFAAGNNAGLAVARAPYVCFLNNDTVVPPGWASQLLEAFAKFPSAGIVVPALTAAGNPHTVRDEPGDGWETVAPFDAPPSAVAYLLRTPVIRELGGWGEEYAIASGEDVDLAFKVWCNELDIVFDRRVLVDHVGHGTSDVKLTDRAELWARNRRIFLAKWTDPATAVPRLDSCPPDRWERNRQTATAAAGWMRRYFETRDRLHAAQEAREGLLTALRGGAGGSSPLVATARTLPSAARRAVRALWTALRPYVPAAIRERLFRRLRGAYYELFPERHPAVLRGEVPPPRAPERRTRSAEQDR